MQCYGVLESHIVVNEPHADRSVVDPDTRFYQLLLRLVEQPSEFKIVNFRDQP